MSKHHRRKVSKTAHYYSIGNTDEPIEDLWIVCHGYGQLASDFIKSFDCIESPGRLIIAPEGLSRFYWGTFTGPVVSSWMTKGDRLDEIEDYCNWLDGIYEEYVPRLIPSGRINAFGFSQGTATIMRWLHARQRKVDRLILWAGSTPEDISYLPLNAYFEKMEKIYVYGTQDKFISPERIQWQKDFLLEQQLDFELKTFDGKHIVEGEKLKSLARLK